MTGATLRRPTLAVHARVARQSGASVRPDSSRGRGPFKPTRFATVIITGPTALCSKGVAVDCELWALDSVCMDGDFAMRPRSSCS